MEIRRGKVTATIGILVLIAAIINMTVSVQAQPSVPPGEEGIYYMVPQNSNATHCNTQTIDVWVNSSMTIRSGVVTIETSDKTCGNITDAGRNYTWFSGSAITNPAGFPVVGKRAVLGFSDPSEHPPGIYSIGNITVHCNSTTCCDVNLSFIPGMGDSSIANSTAEDGVGGQNGTFECSKPSEETFSKTFYEGWNSVSLPLTVSNNSTSNVLASVWDNVSAVYRYNATSKQFDSVYEAVMDPGEGYFVHVSQDCTWGYSGGTPYTSMSIELKQGLNMIGWLNCSKPISDGLSSIADNYYYVARWNAEEQKFKVFNPVAPPVFNDFSELKRGEGYFVSTKADTMLSESC